MMLETYAAQGFIGNLDNWLIGGWDVLLQYLLLFMLIDYVTGITRAAIKKQISSKIGFNGIAKKVGMLVIVAIAHLLDQLFTTPEANIFGIEFPIIRTIVIWGYIINEVTSILQNIKQLGVPMPSALNKILEVLKNENETVLNDKKDVSK